MKLKLQVLVLQKSKLITAKEVLCLSDIGHSQCVATMNSVIKVTNIHTLDLAPSFTSLGSIGYPQLSDKIIYYLRETTKSPNFTRVLKELWQGKIN